jgi:TatD DNase family protein
MIDVHCHLQFHAFKKDYEEAIKRAEEAGVEIIINTGTSIEASESAVELAEKYENLYAIVGVHPHHADKVKAGWDEELIKIAKSSKKVVGIGEIGLDYYSYESNGIVEPDLQKKIFIRQLEIAQELNLPLQIHNRQAGEDIVEILEQNKDLIRQDPPGMFHCFAASREVHKKILEMGFYIGFDGNLTYPGLAKGETVSLSDFAKETPIERIVTETDSPFLAPIPYRGSRNEPAHVIIVGSKIAEVKGIGKEEAEEKTTQNARRIFGLN